MLAYACGGLNVSIFLEGEAITLSPITVASSGSVPKETRFTFMHRTRKSTDPRL